MAANGVNVKMGVEGVSQFKQNMKTAQTAVKTLDAQLALNEKQFKATGDAEAYMEQKTQLLKVKLDEQKAVVASAEKALEQMAKQGANPASEAFQKMQQQLVKAKADMLDTEAAMNDMATAGEEAGNGVDAMNQQLKRVGEGVSFQNVTDALDKIKGGMDAVISKAVEVGKAIVREVLGAGAWADDLSTRATYYGVSEERLQRMTNTAALIDTSVESIMGAQKKLRTGLGKQDKEVMGGLLELLGKGYDPKGKDWETVFWDAGEALMRYTDAEKQEVYAQKLFGKSWNELIPLFETGRKEYEELNKSWNVVPQEQLDALKALDDQYATLEIEFQTLKNTFLGELAPAMTSVMGTLTGLLEKFNEYLQTDEGKEKMQALSDAVTSLFSNLANIDPDKVMEQVGGILDGILDALKWISENSGTVVGAITAIVGAWGLATLSSGVTRMLQLVNGLQGLGGGKGGSPTTVPTGGGNGIGTGIGTAAKGSAAANALNKALANGAATIGSTGMLPAVLTDMFLNQTNAGRALRDGGGISGILEGIKQDIQEKGEEISRNASTFVQDWSENVLFRGLMNGLTGGFMFGTGDAPDENEEWLMKEINAQEALMENQQTMYDALTTMTDVGNDTNRSTSEMTQAANDLKGLPALMAAAVRDVVASMTIYIDGESVGKAVTPHVGGIMGSQLKAWMK